MLSPVVCVVSGLCLCSLLISVSLWFRLFVFLVTTICFPCCFCLCCGVFVCHSSLWTLGVSVRFGVRIWVRIALLVVKQFINPLQVLYGSSKIVDKVESLFRRIVHPVLSTRPLFAVRSPSLYGFNLTVSPSCRIGKSFEILLYSGAIVFAVELSSFAFLPSRFLRLKVSGDDPFSFVLKSLSWAAVDALLWGVPDPHECLVGISVCCHTLSNHLFCSFGDCFCFAICLAMPG